MRDLLERNLLPVRWYDVDTDEESAAMLDWLDIPRSETPVLVHATHVLRNPSAAQVARSLGLRAEVDGERFDLVVLGAGPAGLAAAVYGGSEGLRTFVAEAWAPGGQAGTSTRIENYLGFPSGISGTELTRNATLQARRFDAVLSSFHSAVELADGTEDLVRVDLDDGQHVLARSVVMATGARWRELEAEGVERFRGAGVYHAMMATDAERARGEDVIVVGGGNSAGQAATHLSKRARSVRVVVRGKALKSTMSHYLVERIEGSPRIEVMTETEVSAVHGSSTVESVTLRSRGDGSTEQVPATAVFVMIGAEPCTEPARVAARPGRRRLSGLRHGRGELPGPPALAADRARAAPPRDGPARRVRGRRRAFRRVQARRRRGRRRRAGRALRIRRGVRLMAPMDLGKLGVWTTYRRIEEDQAGEAAALAEQLGYGTFWLGGSPRLPSVRPLLEATESIVVATSIVNIWTYAPAQLAAEYAELARDFRERLLVGIGVGHPEATSDYTRPFSAMQAFLDGVDTAQAPIPRERRCLAALAPKMVALSAERSLGSIPYFTPVEHTGVARAQLGAGPLLAPEVAFVLDTDVERARARRASTRSSISGRATTRTTCSRWDSARHDIVGRRLRPADRRGHPARDRRARSPSRCGRIWRPAPTTWPCRHSASRACRARAGRRSRDALQV